MRYQVFGADEEGAFDLATKRRGLCAQSFAAGGEVDEVIIVDDQRVEIVLFAGPGE
jgi:hypothetical protein